MFSFMECPQSRQAALRDVARVSSVCTIGSGSVRSQSSTVVAIGFTRRWTTIVTIKRFPGNCGEDGPPHVESEIINWLAQISKFFTQNWIISPGMKSINLGWRWKRGVTGHWDHPRWCLWRICICNSSKDNCCMHTVVGTWTFERRVIQDTTSIEYYAILWVYKTMLKPSISRMFIYSIWWM